MLLRRPVGAGRGLAPLQRGLVLVGDVGWLLAWSIGLGGWLGPTAGPLLEPLPLVALLIAAAAATRAVVARPTVTRASRVAVGLLGVGLALLAGALVAGVGPATDPDAAWSRLRYTADGVRALCAASLGLLAWWRGIVAGRARPAHDTVEAAFRAAIGGLAALLLLRSIVSPPTADRSAGALLGCALAVLVSGLVGMALAGVADLTRSRGPGAESPTRINRHWLGMVLGGVILLMLAVLVAAGEPTFDALNLLWQFVSAPLYATFRLLVYVLAVPAGLLAEAMVLLRRLVPGLGQWWETASPPDLSWLDQLRALAGEPPEPPEVLSPPVAGAIVAIATGLAVWMLAKVLLRAGDRGGEDGVEEVRDFVWSRPDFGNIFRRRFRSPSRRRGPTSDRSERPTGDPVREARALYRRLLSLGARRGRPRASAETPREYERALAGHQLFRHAARDLDILTEVYSRARYEAARAALARLDE